MVKASVSRNYRFPTLNDLYFLPGGNPDLKNEHGFSYDAGVSFDVGKKGVYKLGGSASWFDSYIDDWIIWLPTTKGFFSPRNVKKVHAYGVEVKANLAVQPAKDWLIAVSYTHLSDGEPGGEITSLRIPELTKVNGRLGVNNLGKMISLEFPKLQEVGSVDFASIPIPLETLSLPELSVVNGDLNLVSSYIAVSYTHLDVYKRQLLL